jgi:hypothetical protein
MSFFYGDIERSLKCFSQSEASDHFGFQFTPTSNNSSSKPLEEQLQVL